MDYGMVRIGLAISDETKLIASPLKTLLAEKKRELTITKLLQELNLHQQQHNYQISEIIIGLPLLMNGKPGPIADEVLHFIDLFRQQTPIPINTWDERLTSVQAERSMREGNLTRKQRSKSVDAISAVILLQSYLDFKGTLPP